LVTYSQQKDRKEIYAMEDRMFGYFKTSNPFLHQFLHDKGIDPVEDMTEKVTSSTRLVWYYACGDALRNHVEEFRNK